MKCRPNSISVFVLILALTCAACGGDGSEGVQTTPSATTAAPVKSVEPGEPSGEWVIEPGRLGPIAIGVDGGEAKLAGFATDSGTKSCGHRWVPTETLTTNGVYLEFRDGKSVDDLDFILVLAPDAESEVGAIEDPAGPDMRTKEGVGIGTAFSKVRAIYGEDLRRGTYTGEGGDWVGYTAFGPDGGAITFDAGSTLQEESSSVVRIFVSGGTREDFAPPVLGC